MARKFLNVPHREKKGDKKELKETVGGARRGHFRMQQWIRNEIKKAQGCQEGWV